MCFPWVSSELIQCLLSFAHMIMSCGFTSSSCKFFFVVYAFFSWEASCYESFFISHDVSIYCMMELWTSLQVLILRPDIILLELVFPFFLVARRFCINDVTTLIILFFILKCRHLLFGTSLNSSLLVGDYVCGLSYKSNAFVWLETFHKEHSYWQILMHKYMIMQLL